VRDRLSINDAITEVVALIRGEIQRNRISLRTTLSTDVPLVLGDRIQLQQVILNLILNAMEAMSDVSPQPRELSVSSAKDGSNGALVSVRDSGAGLDGTVLDRLFEAFYTTKAHGMGIGPAVSRTIIKLTAAGCGRCPTCPREPYSSSRCRPTARRCHDWNGHNRRASAHGRGTTRRVRHRRRWNGA
jgi:C4-dicarboxylate-specific signal transduction histidine kinase